MTEKREVWVVMGGEYSDSHVLGVFASEDAAQRYAHACNPILDAYVDKSFVVDQGVELADRMSASGAYAWMVIEQNTGAVYAGPIAPDEERTQAYPQAGSGGRPYVSAVVWAADKATAERIGEERIAAYRGEP